MRRVGIVALALLILVPTALASAEWTARLYPSGNSGFYRVVADGSNNSYAAGFHSPSLSGIVASFNSTGGLRWNQSFTTGNSTRFLAIARNSSGQLLVAGESVFGPFGLLNATEGLLFAYGSDGTLLGNETFRAQGTTRPLAIAVDSNDDILVAGTTFDYGSGVRLFLRKVFANRTLAWNTTYIVPGGSGQNWAELSTDSDGNSYVYFPNGQNSAWVGTVAKFFPNGTVAWNSSFASSGLASPHINGLARVNGTLFAALVRGSAYELAAVASNGTQLGNVTQAIANGTSAFASGALAATPSGTVLVAGVWSNGTLPRTLWIDEWNANLTLLRSQRIDAPYDFLWAWGLAGTGSGILAGQMNDTAALLRFNETLSLAVDSTPPALSVSSPQNRTYNTTTILLNASADEPVTWAYEPNGTNASFTPPLNATFPEGPSCVRIWATDAAGNAAVQQVCFTVDATPPVISVTPPANGSANVTVNASANENVTWFFSLDNGTNASFTPPLVLTGLDNGTHTLQICANDTAGNRNCTTTAFTVGTVGPRITGYLLHVFGGSASNATSAAFWPEGNDTRDNVTISINASEPVNWTLELRNGTRVVKSFSASNAASIARTWNGRNSSGALARPGTYSLNATLAGALNTTKDSTRSLTVLDNASANDTVAPNVTVFSPTNTTLASSSVALQAAASEPASFTYSLNNASNATFAPNSTLSGLSDGFYRLDVFATDAAGNVGSATVFFTVSIPSSPPPGPSGGGGGGGGSFSSSANRGGAGGCVEDWTCTEWSACAGGAQTRACTDRNRCNASASRPYEDVACAATIQACEPGELVCAGTLRTRCSADGSELILIEDCPNGCRDGDCLPAANATGAPSGLPVTGLLLGDTGNLALGLLTAGLLLLFFILAGRRRAYPETGPGAPAAAPGRSAEPVKREAKERAPPERKKPRPRPRAKRTARGPGASSGKKRR